MDDKPPVDRSIFIPIFIGFISVIGICLVLFATRLSALRGTVQAGATETPIKFQYLGTEPGVALPTEAPPVATEIPTLAIIDLPPVLTTSTIVPTLVVVPNVPNATNTLVTASPTLLVLNVTHDDVDFKFNYTGNWVSQSGVNDTYHNTLHVSNTIGDSVQLSFVGQKIRILFQAGPSLGTVALKLDNVDFVLEQSASATTSSEWVSTELSLSSHSITITHISGGSINLDAIAVVDLSTPSPTLTPTLTTTPPTSTPTTTPPTSTPTFTVTP